MISLISLFCCVVILNGVISSGEPDSAFESTTFEYDVKYGCRFSNAKTRIVTFGIRAKVEL